MANFTPWMTSNDLLSFIKLNIMLPISQNTLSEEDVLKFCNTEMMIGQVPQILQYHQEYFVQTEEVPLRANVSRYAIPTRAIGSKLRDLFYVDQQGNKYDMARIDSENRALFQGNNTGNNSAYTYYLEGNYIVMSPEVGVSPIGSLLFVYFLRPNQLVTNDRAAIIEKFSKTVTVDVTTLIPGDTLTIGDEVFTAVASGAAADQFNIGTNDATASSLAGAINTNGVATTTTVDEVVTILYTDLDTEIEASNTAALAVQSTQGILFDAIPTDMVVGESVDFLQTLPGHRTKGMNVLLAAGSISAMTISFPVADVPDDLIIGDYICLINECIIPQIPTDLHNSLAERACARILSAIGDQAGLAASNAKLAEIEQRQGNLLDNRVSSSPTKVLNKNGLLRRGQYGWGRGRF